ncbi:MAG: hypothetical protein IJ268_07340, partial [Proteobacteria bacterium]|nr:hypothetical protein [Pseudomonadota bacterium]
VSDIPCFGISFNTGNNFTEFNHLFVLLSLVIKHPRFTRMNNMNCAHLRQCENKYWSSGMKRLVRVGGCGEVWSASGGACLDMAVSAMV